MKSLERASRTRMGRPGQGTAEYAFLVALVGLAVVGALVLMGPAISDAVSQAVSGLTGGPTPIATSPVIETQQSLLSRILAFYQAKGYWPRSWGTYRYTDLGLDPADWSGPVNGVYWNPNGYRLGLANVAGDDIQIYVRDLNGNRRHLYDGWSIWCAAESGVCYYHSIAAGNEVDLETLEVVTD